MGCCCHGGLIGDSTFGICPDTYSTSTYSTSTYSTSNPCEEAVDMVWVGANAESE